MAGARSTRGASLDAAFVAWALALVAARALRAPVAAADLHWHLAMGRAIAAQRAVPTVDAFSFTRAGAGYVDQPWLAQLALWGVYRAGGLALVATVSALAVTAAYGAALWIAGRRTGRWRLASVVVATVAVLVSGNNWLPRPQSLALPLFAALLAALELHRAGARRAAWALPPLFALWANVHGSFVVGAGVLGAAVAAEAWFARRAGAGEGGREGEGDRGALRRLCAASALAAVALLANPRGAGVVGYVRDLVASTPVRGLVTEWAAPSARDPAGLAFFAFALAVALCALAAPRATRRRDLPAVVALLPAALSTVRGGVWFVLAALPLACDALAARTSLFAARDRGRPAANALAIALALGVAVVASPYARREVLERGTPVAAVAHLRALPPGRRPARLFHSENAGSYLTLAAPEQRVFVDTRVELYPAEVWRDYLALAAAEGDVAARLARYGIDGMLLERAAHAPLIRWARASGAWETAYEDAVAVVMLRRPR